MIRSHPLHMGVTAPNLAQQVGYLILSYLTVVMYFLEIHPSFFHKDRHAHGTPSPDKEYSIHWCHQPESESQQDCHSQDTICIISFFEFPTLLNLWATISSQTHTQVHNYDNVQKALWKFPGGENFLPALEIAPFSTPWSIGLLGCLNTHRAEGLLAFTSPRGSESIQSS